MFMVTQCGFQLTAVTIAIEIYSDLPCSGGVNEQGDVSPSSRVSTGIIRFNMRASRLYSYRSVSLLSMSTHTDTSCVHRNKESRGCDVSV